MALPSNATLAGPFTGSRGSENPKNAAKCLRSTGTRRASPPAKKLFQNLSHQRQLLGADETCCQFVKGLKVSRGSFVTQFQAAEVAQPTHRPLDHPAAFAQAAAMRAFTRAQQRHNSHQYNRCDDPREPVAAIADQRTGLFARSSAR